MRVEERVFGDHGSLSVIRYSMIGLFPDIEEKKIVHIYLPVYISICRHRLEMRGIFFRKVEWFGQIVVGKFKAGSILTTVPGSLFLERIGIALFGGIVGVIFF